MKAPAERPIDVATIAVIVAVNGLVSLAEAALYSSLGAGDAPRAIVSGIVGLLLLHRAYALWTVQPGAWLVMLIVVGARGAFSLANVATSPSASDWITMVVSVVGILYLVQPTVRNLLSGGASVGNITASLEQPCQIASRQQTPCGALRRCL